MKITDALLGEHGALYGLLDHVDRGSRHWNLEEAREAAAALAATLTPHAAAEDELLFTALEPRLDAATGPLAVMRREHAEIEAVLGRLPRLTELAEARDLFLELSRVVREHFAKEEGILFPLAERQLETETLHHLGEMWAARRRIHLAA